MFMHELTLSSKKQVTIPAEVCRKLNIGAKSKLLLLEFKPGEFQLFPSPKKLKKKDWVEDLYGKYRDDSIDAVQSLLDDRKEDLILEERGYLN